MFRDDLFFTVIYLVIDISKWIGHSVYVMAKRQDVTDLQGGLTAEMPSFKMLSIYLQGGEIVIEVIVVGFLTRVWERGNCK